MLKQQVYSVLEGGASGGRLGRSVTVFILSLVVLNVAAVALETVKPLYEGYRAAFHAFEVFSVAIFSIEYVLRLWSCTAHRRYARPLLGRLRFAATPFAIADLLAVLPLFLGLQAVDLRALRMLRLSRLLRLAKLGRYSMAVRTLGRVVAATKAELVVTLSLGAVLLTFAASAIYVVEHDVQPDKFSSIPAAMWWAAATITTVGYGDVYPVTDLGRFLGAMIAVLGIGMFALPTGVLGAAFLRELQRPPDSACCPHCGRELSQEQRHTDSGVSR